MNRPKYYSTQEVADLFGVTRRTVYAWISSGRLGAIKAGPKLWKVSQEHLDRFTVAQVRQVAAEVKRTAADYFTRPPARPSPAAAATPPAKTPPPVPLPQPVTKNKPQGKGRRR